MLPHVHLHLPLFSSIHIIQSFFVATKLCVLSFVSSFCMFSYFLCFCINDVTLLVGGMKGEGGGVWECTNGQGSLILVPDDIINAFPPLGFHNRYEQLN